MGNNASTTYPQDQLRSREAQDGIRVAIDYKSKEELLPLLEEKTVYEAFQRGQRVSDDGPLLGRRTCPNGPYEWLSYSQVSDMANAFGAGLLNECHVAASNETKVGIFAQNCVEWVVCDQACVRYSMIPVPLYITFGQKECQHIIKQIDCEVVFCDNDARLERLFNIGNEISNIKHVVLLSNEIGDPLIKRAEEFEWNLLTFEQVMESGRKSPRDLQPARPEDIYTICYTSGTTGVPKGVVLTHLAMTVNALFALESLQKEGVGLTPNDCLISYLPLAHLYERLVMVIMLIYGSHTGFYGGDVSRLFDDMKELQPTIFSAVPRVLHRVYDTIYTAAKQSTMKSYLLQYAVDSKTKQLEQGILDRNTIWDKMVFGKVRELFGGRVRHFCIGSAPVSPVVLNFFRIALGATVSHGYGMTEVGGVATASLPYDFRGDHVGAPVVYMEIKLIDVPSLGYTTENGCGEICMRGPTVFREYYMMPEKTAETIDEEGWVHSGDVGRWNAQGNLEIVDRCKDLFKLSQGEYISPGHVEGVYNRCPHVNQVFVEGHCDKNYPIAIVVPDFELLAKEQGVDEIDREKTCREPEIIDLILKEMQSFGRENGLHGYEIVKKIHLHPEDFSVENGLLSSTLKTRHNELRKHFQDVVKSLYSED